MTERLTHLLHDEADGLDVPHPAAGAVLARGRRLRRRRRVAEAAAAVAVVAVVGAVGLWSVSSGDERAVEPAGPVSTPTEVGVGVVFAIGNEVYLDGGATSAVVADRSVKSLYYTSAGVLVRSGDNPWSDGGGEQRFSLVSADGTVTRLGLVTEETVHATDPAQPYVAYASSEASGVVVHVRDVTTDEEVAAVPVDVEAGFLPVSLVGDVVYLGSGMDLLAVDWRTGEVADAPIGYAVTVAGEHALDSRDGRPVVVEADTGEVVATGGSDDWPVLSPDGRYVLFGQDVHDLESGAVATVPRRDYWGWGADDTLLSLGEDGVLHTCTPAGACETSTPTLTTPPSSDPGSAAGWLVLGGRTYES